jgi:putative lipoprotein
LWIYLTALAALAVWMPLPAEAGVVSGEVFYRERIALPADAVVEVTLLDVTRTDRPGELIASLQIKPRRQVPIPFEIHVADPEIDPRRSYAVRATIVADGRLLFITAELPRVLTQGNPNTVRILLTAVSSGGPDASLQVLTDKTWLAEDIGGRGVLDSVQSTISISAAGVVSGSAGCNSLRGTAQLDGRSLAFSAIATTRKMCPPAVMDQEAKFLHALDRTRELRLEGSYLKFLDSAGAELVRFTQSR